MSTMPTVDCYIFVIKTNSYAGNFERQMCGFLTGEVGECGVGDEEAAIFKTDHPCNRDFEDIIICFPDEHGCHRPASIWGDQANDVAIFLETLPTTTHTRLMRDRAKKFAAKTNPYDGKHNHITISGFELRRYTVTHQNELIEKWKGIDNEC